VCDGETFLTTPSLSDRTTGGVKPDLPDKNLKYSVNAVAQVMFTKTAGKL
jgi:hypothetical protein